MKRCIKPQAEAQSAPGADANAQQSGSEGSETSDVEDVDFEEVK